MIPLAADAVAAAVALACAASASAAVILGKIFQSLIRINTIKYNIAHYFE